MSDSIADEIMARNSPAQLVQHFGGSTKRAAEAAGTSQRTIQRWLTGQYKPGRKALPKIRATMTAKKITLKGSIRINSETRDRTIDFPGYHKELNAEQWNHLSQLAASGDEAVMHEMAAIYGVGSMELIDATVDMY